MNHKHNQVGSAIIFLAAALAVIVIIVFIYLHVVNHGLAPTAGSSAAAQNNVSFDTSTSCKSPTRTVRQAGLTVTSNVNYMNVSQGGLCLDVYRPAGTRRRPPVVLLHSSVNASQVGLAGRGQLTPEAQQLAKDGFVAVNVDWPPEPAYHLPAEVNAVDTALKFIEAKSSAYGIDSNEIGMLGTSGGGVITGYVATQKISYLKADVTWSGAFDPTDPALKNNSALGAKALNDWFGCTSCSLLSQYSAVQHVNSLTPPFALFNSTNELIPVSQPEEMNKALSAAGIPHKLTIYPGTRHAVAYASDAMAPTIQWFQKYLN